MKKVPKVLNYGDVYFCMKAVVSDPRPMFYGATPAIFKFAEGLRKNMTEPEQVIWEFLRSDFRGFKFRRQHPAGRYVLDFYCHRLRLAIEIDGGYHTRTEQKVRDMERENELGSMGVMVVRFTNDEVKTDLSEIGRILETVFENRLRRVDAL